MTDRLTTDDVRQLIIREAALCKDKPWRSTGMRKWCLKHGLNSGHVSEFMNERRGPGSNMLAAAMLLAEIERLDRRPSPSPNRARTP